MGSRTRTILRWWSVGVADFGSYSEVGGGFWRWRSGAQCGSSWVPKDKLIHNKSPVYRQQLANDLLCGCGRRHPRAEDRHRSWISRLTIPSINIGIYVMFERRIYIIKGIGSPIHSKSRSIWNLIMLWVICNNIYIRWLWPSRRYLKLTWLRLCSVSAIRTSMGFVAILGSRVELFLTSARMTALHSLEGSSSVPSTKSYSHTNSSSTRWVIVRGLSVTALNASSRLHPKKACYHYKIYRFITTVVFESQNNLLQNIYREDIFLFWVYLEASLHRCWDLVGPIQGEKAMVEE